MTISRREMLKAGALSACAMAVSARPAPADACRDLRPLDYGLSFLCCTAEFNAVRFWVESRTRLVDDATNTCVDFYQCGSCKSENTFHEQNLFHADNYDFLPIWGDGRWLVFRRTLGVRDHYRTVNLPEAMWGVPVLRLREAPVATTLNDWEAVRDATAAGIPIVAQTEISHPGTRRRAIIEYPVKTMNISLEKRMYQVDTGPLAYPDLAQYADSAIDCLQLAFVAFNASHFADFVVEQEAVVACEGGGTARVYHYTSPFSLPATNTLLALGTP